MTDGGGSGTGGIANLEKDLTCSICTDILYQPLTLLDCLHSFCGSCLREWFAWQATSAAQSRRVSRPYTCPSCRDSVRSTKADWRVATLLEDYLKARPDRCKSVEEKHQIEKHYKPGDDVLVPVRREAEEYDSEDESLMAEVRSMSLAEVNPAANGHRSERTAYRRCVAGRQPRAPLTESRMRQHDAGGPHVGHQPSLRSLLSVSDADPQDVQAEILQSIYSEGLLNDIDVDNLTAEQEEELTERIAEVYRRRQRQRRRDRSRDQQRRSTDRRSPHEQPRQEAVANPSPDPIAAQPSRARVPIARPHVFEQTLLDASHPQRRAAPMTRLRTDRSSSQNSTSASAAASRSATDLSQRTSSEAARPASRRRPHSAERGLIDPQGDRAVIRPDRAPLPSNNEARTERSAQAADSTHNTLRELAHASTGASATVDESPLSTPTPAAVGQGHHVVHPAVSKSAFAPEPVSTAEFSNFVPTINCNRCGTSSIQYELHYNCSKCLSGRFNLCLRCYRAGRGCEQWYGFGYRAFERYYRGAVEDTSRTEIEGLHILCPRRYLQPPASSSESSAVTTQAGAFCDICLSFANDSYWYCSICLDGAWGFCEACVKQGKHCTHQLLAVAHVATQTQPYVERDEMKAVSLPHLPPSSYIALPVPTFCDICHRPVAPSQTRMHCGRCNGGDYDICNDCYRGLGSQGRIGASDGAAGWRRCPSGHRMTVVAYQPTAEGGHLRTVVRPPVGGTAFKEDSRPIGSPSSAATTPPDGGSGLRCLAMYSYFPADGVADELMFPRNAEITDVSMMHEEWYWGVYAGEGNLFPSNHVRML